jgi:predicted ester cyclase
VSAEVADPTASTVAAKARRLVAEVWNGEREDAAYELIHPDHETQSTGERGADGVLGFHRDRRAAFPDQRYEIVALVCSGDLAEGWAALRWRGAGTQCGQFGPVPPTGRAVEYEGATFFRFADGAVRETWSVNDLFGVLRQLGVQVSPPEPGTGTA